MGEEEEKQKLPTHLEYILNNTAMIPILFVLWLFRPEEGYIQRIEFLLFLIEKGVLLENIYQFTSLLPLLIIIPLMFYRERASAGMNNFLRSQIAKEVIKEFDEDSDEKLTKEESQGFFSTIMEDLDEEEKKDFDSDALFDKYDSDRDGKLDGDEISSLILEVFAQELAYPNQDSPSADESVKVDSGEDEMQKLNRLYNEGYLSEERYERLKQDLSR
ncbi:MAG: EF-hand domain-containing protein [Candidatus Thermoplasmatota archaeon]|nr:EF-hand domain-containing protein [Candidatus Thermoplasmatota archaeon]